MLRSVTSEELSEWRAYERLNGALGPSYSQEVLAAIHEMLQSIGRTLVAANTDDEDKVPEFREYPRPAVYMQRFIEEDD